MDYTVRLDVLTPEDGENLKKYLQKYSKYLVYEETSDKASKLHYQGIVRFDSASDAHAAKTRFYDMFKSHSKGKKSMAKVNKKTYEVYIAKDKNCFVYKGYTPEDIEALEAKSYSKSKRSSSWFNTLVEYCKSQGVHSTTNGWDLAKAVLKCYQECSKVEPNDFQLRCYAKSIQRQLVYEHSPERYEWYLTQRAKQIIGSEWINISA